MYGDLELPAKRGGSPCVCLIFTVNSSVFHLFFFMEFVNEKFDFMFHVVFSSLQHSIYCEMRLSVSCARYGDTSVC